MMIMMNPTVPKAEKRRRVVLIFLCLLSQLAKLFWVIRSGFAGSAARPQRPGDTSYNLDVQVHENEAV